ncbi:MAG: DNA mismatch repair protein MutL [Planctomyces sp.]|nr:DNA mismatch repair protein MutL [Planctomyces sp.]
MSALPRGPARGRPLPRLLPTHEPARSAVGSANGPSAESAAVPPPGPPGTPAPIGVLPPLLANQIAAGEVVERPASVVKELVENALDAGCARVTVELAQGGIELVRVSDDGSGIPENELALALAPHATSKVRTAEDLERIATLGFRGEALASILSVSRLSLRSRRAGPGHEPGAVVEGEGDRLGPPRPAPGPVGTTVTVRNLFFNTPARRKFLRTAATEQARCVEALRSIAMARPGVGFRLTCDGRALLDLPPDQSPRARVLGLLGPELEPHLLEAHADALDAHPGAMGGGGAGGAGGPVTLWALVGTPQIARATAAAQHIYVNGRPVRDRAVGHALREAYRGVLDHTRHPTAVLMLELDPAAVDVNVHPAKSEVRFRDASAVHQAVLGAVRTALRRADLTPALSPAPWAQGHGGDGGAGGAGGGGVLPTVPPPGWRPRDADRPDAALFADRMRALGPALAALGGAGAHAAGSPAIAPDAALRDGSSAGALAPQAADQAGPLGWPWPVAQLGRSYLVTQDEHGVILIDQHALHERVMFQALLGRVVGDSGPGLERQRLLVPAVVPLGPARVALLSDPGFASLCDRVGIELSQAGPGAAAVQAFPTLLLERRVEPAPFVADLIDRAEAGQLGGPSAGPDRWQSEAVLHSVLDMMACKAAVKAGEALPDHQLRALAAQRLLVERGSNCPHGRPTSLRIGFDELARRFGR